MIFALFHPPRHRRAEMTTSRTLHLPALLLVAVAVVVACAAALLAVSEKAEATFAGKNGKIAYADGGLYTINPDRGGKTKVAGHPADGYPLDYSPTGKKVTYPHD
jgi:hypothetical protein